MKAPGLIILAGLGIVQCLQADMSRADLVVAEGQPIADLGNGHYRNPIIGGAYADPSVIRVGKDYYMIHSNGGGGRPNLHVWHSRDLVNWRVISTAITDIGENPWAPDIVYCQGKYSIYTTLVDRRLEGRAFTNVVFVADRPEGPWSEPIPLGLYGYIDPGHVVDQEGNRYLYLSKGAVVRLNAEGTAPVGEVVQVYEGWEYPEDWVVECFCLESPKLFFRDGWYYLVSAQGGTVGPATSHMAVVSRSREVLGPWENSPHNPLIRTVSRDQTWWSVGHATLIDDPEGKWWAIYHGILNGYRSIGRQTLMSPVSWTDDGWPVIQDWDVAGIFEKPPGENVGHGMPLSDDFASERLRHSWYHFDREIVPGRYRVDDGALEMIASGAGPADASMLVVKPVNRAYEGVVELEVPPPGAEAGIFLFHDRDDPGGLCVRDGNIYVLWRGREFVQGPAPAEKVFLRVRDNHHDASYAWSGDGVTWHHADRGTHFEGRRVKIGLYAAGEGTVRFPDFKYLGWE